MMRAKSEKRIQAEKLRCEDGLSYNEIAALIGVSKSTFLRYFLWAIWKLYGVPKEDVTFRLNLIEAARPMENIMIAWWAEQLSSSPGQFRKTQFDNRSKYSEIKGNYHGVCTVTYSDTYLFHRLVGVYSAYLQSRIGVKK